ncbi:glycosyltransferase family 8 protein [Metarhizium album ARSEF 1941]|uniref:Glycosyltransferase family 8 protein n=1 Tax=Metarhizium album (strain ARSEF 1941) TaxID=1081103 RepID=A0A0B2WN43_METAS|nr:glycosyltransferase family 8 protein [Metarhizium album ARSEF 1941]KHN94430.1 glycosyltransferase family 8 protein [Metarhizium album ARSEF 1941]
MGVTTRKICRLVPLVPIIALLYFLVAAVRDGGVFPPPPGELSASLSPGVTDWSKFAYFQYVTTSDCLCNAVMIMETLDRLGTRAEKVVVYPSTMIAGDLETDDSHNARLLRRARNEYHVHLRPTQVQHRAVLDTYYEDSFTKLLVFNQTQYERVLHLDSDATVLRLMDELFLLPPCPVAMPRAYWLYPDDPKLASPLMLVQPSAAEFERNMAETEQAGRSEYDMEVVNALYGDRALVLPHRPYLMLTSELARDPDDHEAYLGTDREAWDPVAALGELKYLHFSEAPLPKPWGNISDEMREKFQPRCHVRDGAESCSERDIWNGIYTDFRHRREVRNTPLAPPCRSFPLC